MLELAKVIRDLRTELEEAMVAADGETLLFELGPIEVDVSVAVQAGGEVNAKTRFWVVDVGAQGSYDRTSTQRIKLTLTPSVGPENRSAYVSGTADERRR